MIITTKELKNRSMKEIFSKIEKYYLSALCGECWKEFSSECICPYHWDKFKPLIDELRRRYKEMK